MNWLKSCSSKIKLNKLTGSARCIACLVFFIWSQAEENDIILRLRLFHEKSFSEKYFSENDLRENILRKKKEKKKTRKMFYIFQIRKTFYRKMAWFSVDQENVFRWPLIFRETNIRKCWKYFPVSHFQWNKRILRIWFKVHLYKINDFGIEEFM